MTAVAPLPSSSDWPRILLGCIIGLVLGLLMLGVILTAWWLAIARHELQRLPGPDGLETRLEQAAGLGMFGLTPVYVDDPSGAGTEWLRQIAPELEAQGRQLLLLPAEAEAGGEIRRLARRWAAPSRRPLLLWRDGDEWILCRCDNPRARARARQALAVVRTDEPSEALAPPAPASIPEPRRKTPPSGAAYPSLGPPPAPRAAAAAPIAAPAAPARPAPRLPGDPVPEKKATVSPDRAAVASASPRRPPSPRRTDAPQAQRDAESLFY